MAGHSSITDPSVAFIGPRAAIGNAPFTAGQKFATNLDRSQNIEKFLQAIGGNNQLRVVLAQRLAQMEGQKQRFTDVTGNSEALAGIMGRGNFLEQLLGTGATGFSSSADQLQLRGQQAGNLADLGSGVQRLRAGGLASILDQGVQQDAGVTTQPVDPTSVEAAQASFGVDVSAPLLSGAGTAKFRVRPDNPIVKGTIDQATGLGSPLADTLTSLSGVGKIEADEPFAPRPENTEAQLNAVERTIKALKIGDSFAGRSVVARHGDNGNIVIMVLDPEQVLRTVDRQGATVNE